MKFMLSIRNSEDYLNEKKNIYSLLLQSLHTTNTLQVVHTNLNIWIKTALSQTLPVLARLKAHLVGSWSEGITGYYSWTASIFICGAEIII